MSGYLGRRLLQMVPLLLGISIVVFAVIQAAPGGPEGALLAAGRFVDPAAIEAYRARLGVDQPLPVQYLRWLGAAVSGDLGASFSTSRPVLEMIGERLPATIELMGAAFAIAALAAFGAGAIGGFWPGGWADRIATGGAFLGMAMPIFWLGLVAQLVFGVTLGWLPISGTHTIGATSLGDHFAHLALPAVVLSSRYVASWSRYFRASLLQAAASDHVRTAMAKGLSIVAVRRAHLLRNALGPVASVVTINLAELFTGAVVTETIFAWPGIGRLFVQGMYARDYPLLMGILLLGSLAVVVMNLVADLIYGALDPRVRLR
ncbi:MAG: ABC transporter permease [Gemmatimonadetes bacterium]|nr:ABC transporter permease [Gemmatimonadota bacterium]